MVLTLISIGLKVPVRLHALFIILAPYPGLQQALHLTLVFPPAADNDNEDIHEVQQDKEGGLPRVYSPIKQNAKQRCDRNDEICGIPQERTSVDPKGLNDAHGTHDAGDNEGGGA
jgi:hypothetical protein